MRRRQFLELTKNSLWAALGLVTGSAAALQTEDGLRGKEEFGGSGITLFLSGDVMLGRGIDQILPQPGKPELFEDSSNNALHYVELAEKANGPVPRDGGFDYIWGEALEQLDAMAPAVRLINLESSITTYSDAAPEKGIHYRMNPANIPVLAAAGVNGCSLANNHVMDFGLPGLNQTLVSLQEAGINSAGAGENLQQAQAPATFDTARGRVLLFAAATRSSGVPKNWTAMANRAGVNRIELYEWNVKQLSRQVAAVKRAGDIAVLSIHWGGNWGYAVEEDHRKFAHAVIDQAGIDVVHGHSSHHPRGIEIYNNKLILYGCGDLINDYEGIPSKHQSFRSTLSLMYFPTLDPATGELQRLELIPMRLRNMQLHNASTEEARWLTNMLDRESRRLGAQATLQSNGRISVS